MSLVLPSGIDFTDIKCPCDSLAPNTSLPHEMLRQTQRKYPSTELVVVAKKGYMCSQPKKSTRSVPRSLEIIITLFVPSLAWYLSRVAPPGLVHVRELKPVWPAVLLVQPRLSVGEATRDTALAFWRVGAVEEGNVLVSYVAEPAH